MFKTCFPEKLVYQINKKLCFITGELFPSSESHGDKVGAFFTKFSYL